MSKDNSTFLVPASDGNIKKVVSYVKVILWIFWLCAECLKEVPYEAMRDYIENTELSELLKVIKVIDLRQDLTPIGSQPISLEPDKCFALRLNARLTENGWEFSESEETTGVVFVEGESGSRPSLPRPLEKGYAYGAFAFATEKKSGNTGALNVFGDSLFEDTLAVDVVSVWPAASKKYWNGCSPYLPALGGPFIPLGGEPIEFEPRAVNLYIMAVGQDPDGVAEDPGALPAGNFRQYLVLRLLALAFTTEPGWDVPRRFEALKEEYGFNDEDNFFDPKEGVEDVNELLEGLRERDDQIAKDQEVIAEQAEQHKKDQEVIAEQAEQLAEKDEQYKKAQETIRNLKEAMLKAGVAIPTSVQ